jgi:hypothetical protein
MSTQAIEHNPTESTPSTESKRQPTMCYECDRVATRWVSSRTARFSAPRCYTHAIALNRYFLELGVTDVTLETIGQPVNGSVVGGAR